MKAVAAVRKSLRVRTVFNILGPLLNPASTKYSLIGVYSPALSPLLGATLQQLGIGKALIVHSNGLDELTPMGDAHVVEVTASTSKSYRCIAFLIRLLSCSCQFTTAQNGFMLSEWREFSPGPNHVASTVLKIGICFVTLPLVPELASSWVSGEPEPQLEQVGFCWLVSGTLHSTLAFVVCAFSISTG